MMTSFYNGISGIKTHQSGIDVWANNIANVNTVGYRANMPEFASLFSTAVGNLSTATTNDLGQGSRLQSTAISLKQGATVGTDNALDLAINGEGWFGLKNGEGPMFYTRNGNFSRDATGYMVDQSGNHLLGTSANNIVDGVLTERLDTLAYSPISTPLYIPETLTSPARPTTEISMKRNINPTSDAASQRISSTIVNAAGEKEIVTLTFTKQATQPESGSSWDVVATLGSLSNPSETVTSTAVFSDIGELSTTPSITIGGVAVNFGSGFTGLTAFDGDVLGEYVTQNGVVEGSRTGYRIDSNGTIVASFSNGDSSIVGRIPIYHFQNDQGLQKIGDNLFVETDNSGKGFLYTNPEGEIVSGSSLFDYTLEASNVDLGEALTELIIFQKAYDASSKSITTSDQMLKTVLGLHR